MMDKVNHKKLLWIFAGVLFLRAIFALSVGYVDDDAYHWTWTQNLDWSYFDHPGMVAWLEKLSTMAFGDTRLGIRLPSYICFAGIIYFSWKLVADLFDEVAATFVAALILLTPLWGFGGFVASPEPPFMLLWLLAVQVFWNGVREDDKRWSVKKTWLWLGVIMGVALNTKFPIVLIAPGFGLYLLATPGRRKDLLTIWPWVGALVAVVLLAPVVYWNMKYDWPSFRFQFHDRHTGGGFELARWFKFLSLQMILLSPGVYLSVMLAWVVSIVKFKDPRWRLLFCLSLPSFLVFYPQPLWADFKPHWMGPAYFMLAFGVGAMWSQGLQIGKRTWIKKHSRGLLWTCLSFLIPMNILIYAPLVYPWVPKLARAIAPGSTWEMKNDVSNELFGWPEAGEKALAWQKEIAAETGKEPFLAGHRYEMTAQIWKATMKRTYMLSSTWSHFTITTTPEEYDALKGRDAIMIGNDKYDFDPMEYAKFDSCETREFKYYRADELSRIFKLYHCRNFQGIKR